MPKLSTPEPHYWPDPIDEIEPEIVQADAYREAAKIGLQLINNCLLFILKTPMNRESRIALWQVAFGIGLPLCAGRSMTEIAEEIEKLAPGDGLTRACISKGATLFRRMNGLPPNAYMKDEESLGSYSEARKAQL